MTRPSDAASLRFRASDERRWKVIRDKAPTVELGDRLAREDREATAALRAALVAARRDPEPVASADAAYWKDRAERAEEQVRMSEGGTTVEPQTEAGRALNDGPPAGYWCCAMDWERGTFRSGDCILTTMGPEPEWTRLDATQPVASVDAAWERYFNGYLFTKPTSIRTTETTWVHRERVLFEQGWAAARTEAQAEAMETVRLIDERHDRELAQAAEKALADATERVRALDEYDKPHGDDCYSPLVCRKMVERVLSEPIR